MTDHAGACHNFSMTGSKGLTKSEIPEGYIYKLLNKTFDIGDCWETLLPVNNKGYPSACIKRQKRIASHIFYVYYKGDLFPGNIIRHSCDNPACVNPEHLIQGTTKENVKDKIVRKRDTTTITYKYRNATHCKHGHAFTPENTHIRKRKEGGRQCRECNRIAMRGRYGNTK